LSDNIWLMRGRCHKFGDNVPHGGGIVPGWILARRVVEADKIIPHLFEDIAPGFDSRCKPGDIIVAGKNFGMSPKMNGFVAMHALGLGLLCESMPFLAYRAAVGVGLRIMSKCEGITSICDTGDEVEIDYRSGVFINHTRNIERQFPPIPETLRELIELGGNTGWLKRWWAARNSTGAPVEDAVSSS
jgi:3-isopropylmalate/(R)-2-methylmalate dehydratase small subunit